MKKAITKAAFEYLIKISKKHSKMTNLKYNQLSMQHYFKSKIISKFESQKLFKFRTNMEDFKENFKNGNENLVCLVCEENDKVDSQSHFLNCSVINTEIHETIDANIEDIYSQEEQKIKNIIKILIKSSKLRNQLLSRKSV